MAYGVSKRIGITSLTFRGHVTSSIMWPFDNPYAIPFGTKHLSLDGFQDIQWRMWRNGWHDPDTTSEQSSIDSPYTTSYRLSMVTIALWRTV